MVLGLDMTGQEAAQSYFVFLASLELLHKGCMQPSSSGPAIAALAYLGTQKHLVAESV